MASFMPATGEAGFVPSFSGGVTTETDMPRIQRIGSVRILRGAAGWRGVALRLAHSTGADERFELALTTADGHSITVAVMDQEESVALWRDCGRVSGLPLLLQTCDGVVSEPYPQLGRLAVGPIRIRRRHAFLNDRRPRFLARRKTGRLGIRPVIVAGERMTD
ncbi:DUF6101 family protein [Bosea sp. PAMC 26642]|uniref:DUF6101 family protein n=1 Tax=Bosea sp. (strain PAMC 26642) TaxID=1792307 RepID=UPI00076FE8D4|nr:DUF6101 family protein [Bosea sp. PAMC 26642]AMJ58937.1 hypothetical protein AXW83_00255 [Bosea sp. PAMC 26642]